MTPEKLSQKNRTEEPRNLVIFHPIPKKLMLTSARNQPNEKSVAYLRVPHSLLQISSHIILEIGAQLEKSARKGKDYDDMGENAV